KWVFRGGYEGGKCYGMSEDELMRLYREADAFLNVTASQELREEHMSIPRRVYVESDPFHVQVKVLEGDVKTLNALAAHDIHFSFGENLGQPDCDLPRRVYVESDPFHVQVKVLEGDVKTLNALAAHDIHFSFGENLGQPDCDLPVDFVCWHPTRQPVLMDLWENPFAPSKDSVYSTVTT